MNILYINHYAGAPTYGMEYRPYYLAREWVRLGHRVRLLGADFSHVRTLQPQRPTGNTTKWLETIDGIEYQWYATSPYSGNGVARVRNIATFLSRVALDTRRLLREFRPDVVIASSTYPMDIWVARRLARIGDAKLVFEVHDLWPLSPIEIGGMSPSHPFIRVCQAAEDTAYRDADLIVSMLPNMAAYVSNKGLPTNRLFIVPNGISMDGWQEERNSILRDDLQAAINSAKSSGSKIIVYTGSHGLPNSLDTLLDAARILQKEPFAFILVGDGHERERLQSRVRDEMLNNVKMFVPIPKKQIATLLSYADMAYLGAPPHQIYRFGVSPNKMIDYMMASIPILYAIEAGNDPVTEANCGLSIPAENPQELAAAIRRISGMTAESLATMGNNGRKFATTHHTYDSLAKKFINAINSVNHQT